MASNYVSLHKVIEVYRQILVPTEGNHNIELPPELFGKKVEVLAFALPDEVGAPVIAHPAPDDFYSSIRLSFSDFTFNRDEANER